MKLALGTVQFGLNYGAFNQDGAVTADEAENCLAMAADNGIDLLDTARAYGESEAVLGRFGAAKCFRIVTKVPGLAATGPDGVEAAFAESLNVLGTNRVYGLLLHRAEDLLGGDGTEVWRRLAALRDSGAVERIGVSVYSPDEALALLDRFPINLVQAPFNVFDQRMRASGAFDRLRARGVEIHIRSVFLQGFTLADPARLPSPLMAYSPLLGRFRAVAEAAGRTPLELALSVALHDPAVDKVVVGVNSAANLAEIVAAAAMAPFPMDVSDLASDDPGLINPACWGQQA